jgi:DNA modification methylase
MTSAPYYEGDGITLYLGDCLEIDSWLTADVLVTDPPYGIGYESRVGKSSPIHGDCDTAVRDAALLAWGQRPALVFGVWRIPRPMDVAAMLIWDKSGAGGFVRDHPNIPWGRTHEEVYVLGAWPQLTPGGRTLEGGSPSAEGSVLRVRGFHPRTLERPDHPTPKPVSIMEMLVKRTTGVIADPFAGSGSTLVAAKLQGRNAIGVELVEKYAEIAARRLSQGVLHFDQEPA